MKACGFLRRVTLSTLGTEKLFFSQFPRPAFTLSNNKAVKILPTVLRHDKFLVKNVNACKIKLCVIEKLFAT